MPSARTPRLHHIKMLLCTAWICVNYLIMHCMIMCGLSHYALHDFVWTISLCTAWICVDYLIMHCMNMCGLSHYALHDYVWTILLCTAWICVDYLVMHCMNMCGLSRYALHEYVWTISLCTAWMCGLSCYALHEYVQTILLCTAWICADYLVMHCRDMCGLSCYDLHEINTCGLSSYDLHEYMWTILLWPAWIHVDYLVMHCMNTCGLSPGVLSSLHNCIHSPETETTPPKTLCGRLIRNGQTNKQNSKWKMVTPYGMHLLASWWDLVGFLSCICLSAYIPAQDRYTVCLQPQDTRWGLGGGEGRSWEGPGRGGGSVRRGQWHLPCAARGCRTAGICSFRSQCRPQCQAPRVKTWPVMLAGQSTAHTKQR